jgi:uncharacterized protein YjbJ (UPF0337 family)
MKDSGRSMMSVVAFGSPDKLSRFLKPANALFLAISFLLMDSSQQERIKAHQQGQATKESVQGMKEGVQGKAHEAKESVQDMAHHMQDKTQGIQGKAHEAKQSVKQDVQSKAQGMTGTEDPSYLHGIKEKVVGGVKETFGKMTGSIDTQATGFAQKAKGKAEQEATKHSH